MNQPVGLEETIALSQLPAIIDFVDSFLSTFYGSMLFMVFEGYQDIVLENLEAPYESTCCP